MKNLIHDKNNRRIHILREDVARKIAAGEVIDRPFSVVRELIDNSIDAKSCTIDVHIRDGGMSEIRIVDDGVGMSAEDLRLCYKRHATSKIENAEDIYRTMSLGFRGEALSSIATCSRLEIVSKTEDSKVANRLIVEGGNLIAMEETAGKNGTVVSATNLFFNMPARKTFLKNTSSEAYMCRTTFIEKALPFPEITFKFYNNGAMKDFLPASNLIDRVAKAFKQYVREEWLFFLEDNFDGMNIKIVGGEPTLARKDKRLIQVYLNGRRVNEYSLMKSIEWAYSRNIPGGYYPVCFAFVEMDPSFVDFNIHPAKREVRIRNINLLKSRMIDLIGKELSSKKIRMSIDKATNMELSLTEEKPYVETGKISDGQLWRVSEKSVEGINASNASFHYIGQVFGVFLAVEYEDKFILIDQHAAHERIIFDDLMRKEYSPQELMFPISFTVADDEAIGVDKRIFDFRELGIVMEKVSKNTYEIVAMPEDFLFLEERELISLIKQPKGQKDELKRAVMDSVACKMAIKEGDSIDSLTAVELIKKTLSLDDARCPHGRPVWVVMTREELYRKVMRT